jgi:Fe-S cluster assembly protein SufD
MSEQTATADILEIYGTGAAPAGAPARPWLERLRAAAGARAAATGLPTPKLESWKYTNLRPLEKLAFGPRAAEKISIDRLPSLLPQGQSALRLVFVNGLFRADLSACAAMPAGVRAGSLAEALAEGPGDDLAGLLGQIANGGGEDQAMLDLNTALMADGFILHVAADVHLDQPIEVIYLGAAPRAPQAFHPRCLIVMEENSRAIVVEHHDGIGDGAYFANHGCEIQVGERAELRHYKVQAEADDAIHLANVQVEVHAEGVYDSFVLTRGARLSRNEVCVRLEAPGAACHLNGVYMLRGNQHCDNTTTIEHLAPETASREVFKGVLDDRARGVFQGKIVVHPKAQKSDGHQLSKALLLSDHAEIDAKPELEIYADDVKCSHGATAGDMDRDALFYLRARGIPEEAARHMLIEAFLSDTINSLAAEGLCPALMSSVGHWLSDAATRGAP